MYGDLLKAFECLNLYVLGLFLFDLVPTHYFYKQDKSIRFEAFNLTASFRGSLLLRNKICIINMDGLKVINCK